MTRVDNLKAILLWEGIAEEAKARAAAARQALTDDATTELAEQGSAPSWRFAGLGQVLLPLSKTSLSVSDPAALVAWVQQQYPTEVEMVPTIRPAFLDALGKRVLVEGDVVVDPSTGAIVPGYRVLPGGAAKALTIRADSDAKGQARADAAALVERLEYAMTVESTP